MNRRIEEFIRNLDFLDIKDYLGYALRCFMIYRIGEAARKAGFYIGEEMSFRVGGKKKVLDLTFFDLKGKEVAVIEFEQSDDKKIDYLINKLSKKLTPYKILITVLPKHKDDIREKIKEVSSKDKESNWIFGNIDLDSDKKFGLEHWWWRGCEFYEYRGGELHKTLTSGFQQEIH